LRDSLLQTIDDWLLRRQTKRRRRLFAQCRERDKGVAKGSAQELDGIELSEKAMSK